MKMMHRLSLALRILTLKNDSLQEHAQRELGDLLEAGEPIARDLLELVSVFSTQGHSGFSAAITRLDLQRLLDYLPLSPLSGEDDEWVDTGFENGDQNPLLQNKRCSRVFRAWYQGRGWEAWIINDEGRRTPISFPYMVAE